MWLTRNEEGLLTLHKTEPLWQGHYYVSGYEMDIDSDLFPEVTFENSPVEVKVLTLSQIEDKYQEGYDNGYRAAEDCYCNNRW